MPAQATVDTLLFLAMDAYNNIWVIKIRVLVSVMDTRAVIDDKILELKVFNEND